MGMKVTNEVTIFYFVYRHIPARDGIHRVFHKSIPRLPRPAVAVEAPRCTASVSQPGAYLPQSLTLPHKQMETLVLYRLVLNVTVC